jgi:integrase
LISEFDGSEADSTVALFFARVELPERNHRLPIALLIEGDGHPESIMVRRRAADAGIETAIGCHTFRATGITDYLTNGGRIEVAQRMAGHSNAKTTGLYDRRNDDISVGEVERIGI